MVRAAKLLQAHVLLCVSLAAGCSSRNGDPPAVVVSTPVGSGSRIRQITNPAAPTHPTDKEPTGPHPKVTITGASFIWLDTYDETHDGKSRGSVYVQDVGSSAPYSGVSVFKPAYVPADLRVAPGDVLDFTGPYEELINIGSAMFDPGNVLPQLSGPVVTFRYEYTVPTPTVINPKDLETYATGRQWMSMLVTVPNVTIEVFQGDASGRVTARTTLDPSENGWSITNELMPIAQGDKNKVPGADYAAGQTFKSVTGIVTWFLGYHIAPRTPDDLVE